MFFKVVVNVVGEHMSGTSIDSRTSYIGDEIVWGARCHATFLYLIALGER